ncbi:hypothetical protein F1D05_28525 [Kribbella qitaiheensis]|uniref:Uncharacterized protein n=1 Tax=Kribbella qitaiheensis TaxID=1544730 RepID=A0A7G6X4H3_9ACTN|nr:hypothetical protein [Kribbella qitaiheensis]QNE21138.1 hypothetical protein F1D05_28525 [Kribbella qitaiheensis]
MRSLRLVGLVIVPPILLAVAGLVHPHFLTVGTARSWQRLHVFLLPVFPLLAVGFIAPLWRRPGRDGAGVATVVAWVGAFTYAVFYTGLDLVAGFSAGTVARNGGAFSDLGAAVQPLFAGGDAFGRVGVYGFLVAAAAMTVALCIRYGVRAVPGGVILIAAGWSFRDSHIFWPRGVLTMLAIALGFALSARLVSRPRP